MKIKPWLFLAVSILILAGVLAIHVASQARQDEVEELEREAESQLQQLQDIGDQLNEAMEKMAELEDMLLNLRRMEALVTGAPSRGGRVTVATMPLTTPSGYSAARFELALADTGLAGIGEALVAAEEKTGINGLVLVAICAHESGWGASRLARDKGNLAGLGAYDGREYACGMTFDSRADCIMFLARLLQDKPGSLDEVGRWYASDPRWAAKVAGCVRMISERGAE